MSRLASVVLAGLVTLPGVARADEGPGEGADAPPLKAGASAKRTADGEDDEDAEPTNTMGGKRGKRIAERNKQIAEERNKPWIRRWEPQRHLVELGVYGGLFAPSLEHDLYDPVTAPPDPFWRFGGEAGLRAAYFPLRPLGVELEYGANLVRTRNLTDDPVFLFGFRGHVIAQMPVLRIVPFLLAGYGLLAVRSSVALYGDDTDPAFHYGGGVKFNIWRWVSARVEARQIVSASEALEDSGTFHYQVLGGLSFVLNRRLPKVPPEPPTPDDPDRDHDGLLNEVDQCPDDAGVAPTGCPDSDGDGFIDQVDACPEVPGVEPDGCPMKDTDEDKIADLTDDCVFQPETYNNNEDDDGCPDDLPPKLVQLTKDLRGIEFEFGKDTIRSVSMPVLDEAVAAMKEFPMVKVRIVGHTDNIGKPEANLDLSKRRAAAVKSYLVERGIEADRIETDGKGDTDPIATNDTEAGRAQNRRIEFVVTENPQMEVPR